MKPSLQILALIATIAVTTEATDPATLVHVKSQIGNLVLNAATSAIQAKQNLIKSGAAAIINAKTNFLQKKLPHLVHFKANQINNLLAFKKNILKSKIALVGQLVSINNLLEFKNIMKSKIAHIGQLTGGNAIQAAEQGIPPYNAPQAAPPVPYEEPLPYSPLPPLQSPAGPPAEASLPYPPTSPLTERQLTDHQGQPTPYAQTSFQPQNGPSYEPQYNQIQYSNSPTPPPPPPLRHIPYV